MKVKRFAAAFLAAAMMVSVGAIPASASSDDTSFKFNLGISGAFTMDSYTSRIKGNDTSSYINYQAGPSALLVRIYGTNTLGIMHRSGNWYPDVTDCVSGYYSTPKVTVGKRGFIRQLVKERGFPYAVIGGTLSDSSVSATCTGKWSPDSVSESGVQTLN